MFKNLNKNGGEMARLGTLRAQRSALTSVAIPDGCAALVALYLSYSSGVGLGDFGALRALVDALGQGVTQLVLTASQTGASLCVTRLAECEGGRAWACEGAPVEVLRSRVGTWQASAVGSMKKKNFWAVELLAKFSRHTGGGGGGGARTAPPHYKCIMAAPLSAVGVARGKQ